MCACLTTGESKRVRLYNRPGDDMYPNKGDLWKFNIRSFHFSKSCITKEDIRGVTIEQGGNDGWNIESVMTVLHTPSWPQQPYEVITANMHVGRWIDGNGRASQRKYALNKV